MVMARTKERTAIDRCRNEGTIFSHDQSGSFHWVLLKYPKTFVTLPIGQNDVRDSFPVSLVTGFDVSHFCFSDRHDHEDACVSSHSSLTMRLVAVAVLLQSLLLQFSSVFSETKKKGGGRIFLRDSALGQVDHHHHDDASFSRGRHLLLTTAANSLVNILQQRLGASGRELFVPGIHENQIVEDKLGHKHVRFDQTYQGRFEVVDAAVVMHMDPNGTVYSINGEFVVDGSVDTAVKVSCDDTFEQTLAEYGIDAVWLSDCALKIVMDTSGQAHLAWQRMISYTDSGFVQNTYIYASVVTGEVVAMRPQIAGALPLRPPQPLRIETQGCENRNSTINCTTISRRTNFIYTQDDALKAAHKNTRTTLEWLKTKFGRNSLDGRGQKVYSYVHFGNGFNNSFYTGSGVSYGDGDGAWLLKKSLSVKS